jgi:hypothetical protein
VKLSTVEAAECDHFGTEINCIQLLNDSHNRIIVKFRKLRLNNKQLITLTGITLSNFHCNIGL